MSVSGSRFKVLKETFVDQNRCGFFLIIVIIFFFKASFVFSLFFIHKTLMYVYVCILNWVNYFFKTAVLLTSFILPFKTRSQKKKTNWFFFYSSPFFPIFVSKMKFLLLFSSQSLSLSLTLSCTHTHTLTHTHWHTQMSMCLSDYPFFELSDFYVNRRSPFLAMIWIQAYRYNTSHQAKKTVSITI